jgi:YfiH family protein
MNHHSRKSSPLENTALPYSCIIPSTPNGVVALTIPSFPIESAASDSPYGVWNFSGHVGDEKIHVEASRNALSDYLKNLLNHEVTLVSALQVHGIEILDCSDHTQLPSEKKMQGDILITTQPWAALMILHADCQAGVLWAPLPGLPSKWVIAAVHAGWKGMVQDIYIHCIQYLKHNYSIDPSTIGAYLSPCISPEHLTLPEYRDQVPDRYWNCIHLENNGMDLVKAAIIQLNAEGVKKEQIQLSNICTFKDQRYSSYRRFQGAACARGATVICMC